jgi:Bacterial type III secretion protein (HrpB1_HrpK)
LDFQDDVMNRPYEDTFLRDALIDIVSLGLGSQLWSDVETVNAALRALQPERQKLALFDAMVAMGREEWLTALDHLVPLVAAFPDMDFCWSLMMSCLFSRGDLAWREIAQCIVERDPLGESAAVARQMLYGKEETEGTEEAEETTDPDNQLPTNDVFEIVTHRVLLRGQGMTVEPSQHAAPGLLPSCASEPPSHELLS